MTQAPWIRTGLEAPIGRNSPSPRPISFSAPGWSRMTRESASDEVANASRDGTLALIRPVTTSTRRALGGQHQVDAGGPGELGDPDDRVLDVARGDHHQVGQLVDDHQQVRVRPDHPLAARRRLDLAGAHLAVEVVDVADPVGGEVVVAHVHLADDPVQRVGRLLRVGHDRRDQVRDALVAGHLDPLRVDQQQPHLVRGGPGQDARPAGS